MGDASFAGSIPRIYESHLVPLIFEDYAADLATRLATQPPRKVLEVAAGTGVVTRALARVLPPASALVATDLNPAMLEEARRARTSRPVDFREADAQALPFADGEFDAVVVQFGVMFYPDRPRAHAEARRVLKPGGLYLFNVWDSLAHNDFPRWIAEALETVFPQDPPRFLGRTPYGYSDPARITADVMAGGFGAPRIDTVARRSRAPTAEHPAIAFCQGTPLRGEIEARDPRGLARATAAAATLIARNCGAGPVEGGIQAHVVAVRR